MLNLNLTDEFSNVKQWTGQARPTVWARTGAINFIFDGSGTALVAGQQAKCKVGMPCRITLVEILADFVVGNLGLAGAATFTLLHGSFTDHPGATPLYGAGPVPTLLSGDLGKKSVDFSAWPTQNLHIEDFLYCKLLTVSGGITNITLALTVRIYESGQGWGLGGVVDQASVPLVDDSGNPIVIPG